MTHDDHPLQSQPSPVARRHEHLFMLRLWRETPANGFAATSWRCSLEEPRSGQRRGFASIVDLVGYLLRCFGGGGAADDDADVAGDGGCSGAAGRRG